MPNNYIAPYLISDEPAQTYEGVFTVPICTTRERFDKIMNALWAYGAMQGEEADFDHLVDWLDALPRIVEGCVSFGEQCRTISKDDARVTWYPARDAEELPAGYLLNPWIDITGDNPFVGLKAGDVITDVAHLPPLPTIWDHLEDIGTILTLGYPTITIDGLTGDGKIRIFMVSVLLGGRLLFIRDNNLLTFSFADSNLDTASLPPETYAENIYEHDFEGDTLHRLDIVFIPNVSADIEFLGFGGGLRRIEICGFGDATMEPECCDDLVVGQNITNELLAKIVAMIGSGFKIVPIASGEVPDSFAGGCAPDHYDEDTDDEGAAIAKRVMVLCFVIEQYITMLIYKSIQQMGLPMPDPSLIFPILASAPPALQNIVVVYPVPFSLLALAEALLDLGGGIDTLVCEMREGLTNKLNTYDVFKQSLLVGTEPDEVLSALRNMVFLSNQFRANWENFNAALEQGMDMEMGDYECPCPEVALPYPVLVGIENIGTFDPITSFASQVFTEIDRANGVWRLQQDTLDPVKERYILQFEDQWQRCINVTLNPPGYATQSNELWWEQLCNSTFGNGTGGGAGHELLQLGIDRSTPFDTYYKIELVP